MDSSGSMGGGYQIAEGTDVVGSDGAKVGEVVAVHPDYVVVEKGFFFPTDYYIPTSAVASQEGGKVYLSVTKDEALNQGWDQAPAAGGSAYATDSTYADTATTASGGYATDATATGGYATGGVGSMDTDNTGRTGDFADASMAAGATTGGYAAESTAATGAYAADATTTGAYDAGAASRTSQVSDADTLRVPVHEEELAARTRQVERGEVVIEKDVVAEERVLSVPVTEERVRVERRAVDRDATGDPDAFVEGTIDVPVRGEEVELTRTARVAEEVEVSKEAVQRTERVAGTVRREEVRVQEVEGAVAPAPAPAPAVEEVRRTTVVSETDGGQS